MTTTPGALAKHRRLLSTALVASAVAAVVLVVSGFPDRLGAGSTAATAATATALVPVHVRVARKVEALPLRLDPSAGRSGILLYFLMEAARPQSGFGR
jgi:hypothetical protein